MKTRTKSQTVRLGELSKSGAGRPAAKPQHCRICLADETWIQARGGAQSSLVKGICRDRQACESRQPLLFGDGEQ